MFHVFPISQTPPLFNPVTQLSTPTPPGSVRVPPMDITSHSPLFWNSLICDKVGRKHCCMEEDEDSMRVNRVLQRDMRAKAEYEPVTEVESLTNKSNRRNGDLGRGYESMESLTEKMSRELVVKEAKRLELEKKALEAEKKRKLLEAKYETPGTPLSCLLLGALHIHCM